MSVINRLQTLTEPKLSIPAQQHWEVVAYEIEQSNSKQKQKQTGYYGDRNRNIQIPM